jgi:hypothetical protein
MTEQQSDTGVIARFFRRPGEKAAEFVAQLKELTAEDRTQLAEGIRNGTFTY